MSTPPMNQSHKLPFAQDFVCGGTVERVARFTTLSGVLHDDHKRRSVDDEWDRSGRPLDVARSRRAEDYGRPLPTTIDDWTKASGMEQHTISRPTVASHTAYISTTTPRASNPRYLRQVANPQQWINAINAADAVNAIVLRQQQLSTAAINKPLPLVPVNVACNDDLKQEIAVRTQRSSSSINRPFGRAGALQPTTTIEQALEPQTSEGPDRTHIISSDHELVVTEVKVNRSGLELKQSDTVAQGHASAEHTRPSKRRSSIKNRIKIRASNALKALCMDSEEVLTSEPSEADKVMAKWRASTSRMEKQRSMRRSTFEPFRVVIEEALDSKYTELRGAGKFLINDDLVDSTVDTTVACSTELPVDEEEAVAPNEGKRM